MSHILFCTLFIIVYVITFFMDVKPLKSRCKREKGAFWIIHAATAVLFAPMLFDLNVPMPTLFFVHKVSPWLSSLLR